MVFGFGPFELDLATCELRRDGRSVPLQPRVFAVLRYLVEHRDRVIGKQELIDALWGGHQLNAVAVPWTINRARKALGTREQGFIQTIRGHGYRFVGEVRVVAADSVPPSDRPIANQAPSEPPRRLEEPFLGRDQVMQRLVAGLEAAAEGHGSLWLLTGEAGIGKTRCAHELAVIARRRGLQVWVGRCFESGVAPAFWPFIQVLRAACADPSLHESVRREGEGLLKEFEPRNADSASPPDARSVSDDARFWLLDRLSRWLCRGARSQLRIIEIDDIHSADESSLQALALLAPLLAQAHMFVLATARDQGAEAARSVPGLTTRLRPLEHVALSGLLLEDVEAYLRATLDPTLAARLAQSLRARTAGNPLFVREVTRVIRAQREREQDFRIEDVQLPKAVKEIISARFHELPTHARALLDAACVIGEEFTLPVLQRASGFDAETALAGLGAATLSHIVEPRPDGSKHAFVHPLMREVLYAALPPARRAHLHAAVGVALEQLGVIEPRFDELAYHFHHAPTGPHFERAVHYGLRAGDAAMHVLAYDEAVQFYAWALEAQPHAGSSDLERTCELLLRSAAALLPAGRRAESRRQCERAIELAREARLPAILVRAVRLMRPTVWFAWVPDRIAVQALEEALSLLPESETEMRARAYSQLASLPPYALRIELSRKMSDEATRLAGSSENAALRLEVQRSRLFGLSGADTTEEQLRVASEIVKNAGERASTLAAEAQLARYHAFLRRGENAAADSALDAFERIAKELRLRRIGWTADRLRAQRMLHAGRLDEAEHRFKQLFEESERLQLPFGPAYYRGQIYALNLERTGKRGVGLEPPQARSWVQNLPVFRTQRLLTWLCQGDTAQAAREFQALSQQHFAAATGDPTGLFLLCQLSVAAVALGEREAASELLERLAPHAELIAFSAFTLSVGCVARYIAELQRFLGRAIEARRAYETAIAVNERTEHAFERLRACLGLAQLLSESRVSSERSRARRLTAEVSALAQRYGAEPLRAAAVELGARLTAAGVRSLAVPSRATPRRSARTARPARSRAAR